MCVESGNKHINKEIVITERNRYTQRCEYLLKKIMNKNKNITLVTWIGDANYGTCLQSFALNNILMSLGYNVKFLNGLPQRYSFRLLISYFCSIIGLTAIKRKHLSASRTKKVKRIEHFHKKYYNIKHIYLRSQENGFVRNTDVFITGSDQIWNSYFRFNPFFFLDFAKDKKRIAYASSIGTTSVNPSYVNEIKGLLNRFSHIGVRELEAVRVLSELTSRTDIVQVVDPTFLITSEEWHNIACRAEIDVDLPSNYVFCYWIGNNDNYIAQLQNIQQRFNIKNVVIVPAVENPNIKIDGAVFINDAGPLEFLNIIAHASLICTDSFHATALSINMSKPFIEFLRFKDSDTNSQNSRLYDLLGRYNLMSRLYSEREVEWLKPIDYDDVQQLLHEDRIRSLSYLINAIEY